MTHDRSPDDATDGPDDATDGPDDATDGPDDDPAVAESGDGRDDDPDPAGSTRGWESDPTDAEPLVGDHGDPPTDQREFPDGEGESPDDPGGQHAAGTSEAGPPRQLHPLSIPYRAVAGALNLGTLVLVVTIVGSGSVDLRSLGVVASVIAYLALMVAYQTAYYRRFEYVVGDGSLDIVSGVVSRREREIPLRRVQNVDVAENPVQRALGIAAVRIETAGGGDSEASLQYVSREEARRLRADLTGAARATGEAGEPEASEAIEGEATGEAPAGEGREEIFELPNRDLVVLSMFTLDPGAGAISSVVGAFASTGDPENVGVVRRLVADLPGGIVQSAVVGVVVFALMAWVLSFALTFSRYYGFRLVRAGEDLEYERGLFQRYTGTIPTDKIQTVSVHENPLKRRFGYASLAVETAGYGPSSGGGGSESAVPLAPRERVVAIAQSIEPFEAGSLDRPPRRARVRYGVRYSLVLVALVGVAGGMAIRFGFDPLAYWYVALALAPLVPLAAHLRWTHLGYHSGESHFVARQGYWRRVTRVVPYYRIQTVEDGRSVFQRRRNLASVTADTASSRSLLGGSATAVDVDRSVAEGLVTRLRERLTASLDERRGSGGTKERSGAGSGDGPGAAGG